MRGQSSSEGERPGLLGFAVLSPTYGQNRPHGRSIGLWRVECSQQAGRGFPIGDAKGAKGSG